MKRQKIYIASFCDDNGEYEVAAKEDGTMLDCWSCNDATWRGEYLNGFMKELGITVIEGDKIPKSIVNKMQKAAKEAWGFE